MNWDFGKAWEYVSAALDKPAQWLAAAINYAPKTALVIAVVIAVKALL